MKSPIVQFALLAFSLLCQNDEYTDMQTSSPTHCREVLPSVSILSPSPTSSGTRLLPTVSSLSSISSVNLHHLPASTLGLLQALLPGCSYISLLPQQLMCLFIQQLFIGSQLCVRRRDSSNGRNRIPAFTESPFQGLRRHLPLQPASQESILSSATNWLLVAWLQFLKLLNGVIIRPHLTVLQ